MGEDPGIERHEQEVDPTWSAGDPGLLDALTAHLERHVGPVAEVWHQRVSPWVHVDVLRVDPSPERPCYTLLTCGMSERPMTPPEDDPALRHAELTMVLPPDWPVTGPAGLWPFGLLQDLAQLPHRFDTWLWTGHTIPNGDPPEPYVPGTGLCGAILAPPVRAPDGFERADAAGRAVTVHGVIALHAAEMAYKLDRGAEALFDRLDEAGVGEDLDPSRPSAVPEQRRRGLFGRRRR
jgi:hypothetical protein